MREYLLCLFAAAAVTYLATAPVRRLAIGIGAVAEVRDRDVHAEPTPRLGGLAMFLGLLAGMLLSSKLPMMREVFPHTREWFGLLAGCTLIVALGVVDDRFGLDAPTKFAPGLHDGRHWSCHGCAAPAKRPVRCAARARWPPQRKQGVVPAGDQNRHSHCRRGQCSKQAAAAHVQSAQGVTRDVAGARSGHFPLRTNRP